MVAHELSPDGAYLWISNAIEDRDHHLNRVPGVHDDDILELGEERDGMGVMFSVKLTQRAADKASHGK
eukprot:CAMPEP_0181231608 /NCGR_PEP_ID=MMETSP1096-20121128/35215_1 /TAXON_ID=156174 ORGANISM="Chrysochromulina ericina, Strain CCMP281" /NCGR_SAMPLE_ID=MMETSP1096 /ASSEMBLY_ACC=CAM_ASM_000453 /LENGTH=67 /DNA_ID=CAMNT_0023325697 /DNA_START=592 /DNA_END=795 /DNA_ORIENTATION=-